MSKVKILSIITLSLLVGISSGQQVLGYGGPPEQSSSGNYTVEIYSDKESYGLGESVIFSGNVSKFDEERSLRISIYDTSKNLLSTEKTPVNSDRSFSYDILLNDEFAEGKYIVKAQYGNSRMTVQQMSIIIDSAEIVPLEQASSEDVGIPEWVKSNAGWWAKGEIDDHSFVQGIQFMIKEGLMKVPITEQGADSQNNEIPEWVKSNAGWWAKGEIDDHSFVQGIQFMIKEGLMKVSQ